MLVDAHAHMDHYGENLDAALDEIFKHRIFTISTSMDLPSYKQNLRISKRCNLVLPTFGIHPYRAVEYVDSLEDLNLYIEQSPLIGEIGLDFHWVKDRKSYPAQRKVFEHFIASAGEQEKIVNLHTKGAEREILDFLIEYEIKRPIIHWYSGPFDILDELVSFGAYFTVGVELLYSDHIKAIVKKIPGDKILTETDNPSAMQWLGDKTGMPIQIRDVIRALAELRNTSEDAIVQTVLSNFIRLTKDDPWLSSVHAILMKS